MPRRKNGSDFVNPILIDGVSEEDLLDELSGNEPDEGNNSQALQRWMVVAGPSSQLPLLSAALRRDWQDKDPE